MAGRVGQTVQRTVTPSLDGLFYCSFALWYACTRLYQHSGVDQDTLFVLALGAAAVLDGGMMSYSFRLTG